MEKTRQIHVGSVAIGGGAPIAIQSMSTFSPVDTEYAAAQINALHAAGADIVRVAVPDRKAAEALGGKILRIVNDIAGSTGSPAGQSPGASGGGHSL